jgi:hypothetical protein
MLVAATLELSQRFSLRVGDSVSTERGVPRSELCIYCRVRLTRDADRSFLARGRRAKAR